MMRWLSLSVGLFLAMAPVAQANPFTLDDIQLWAGTGSNRAGFIADWNTGGATESIAWGYRWDGTATGEDMIRAIAGAGFGLYATLDFFPGFGFALVGIGYDLNRDGQFAVVPPLAFSHGIAEISLPDDSRTSSDSGDQYREGFNAGFWSYWVKSDASGSWDTSSAGISSRVLTDGALDGFSFAPGFVETAPSDPVVAVAIPEPTSLMLVMTAGVLLLLLRRARKLAGPGRRLAASGSVAHGLCGSSQ